MVDWERCTGSSFGVVVNPAVVAGAGDEKGPSILQLLLWVLRWR